MKSSFENRTNSYLFGKSLRGGVFGLALPGMMAMLILAGCEKKAAVPTADKSSTKSDGEQELTGRFALPGVEVPGEVTSGKSARNKQPPEINGVIVNEEFEWLFDGASLEKFRGYANEETGAGWKIEGGAIHFDGTGGGDICTREEFGDFELVFDWKVVEGANSGVMYRVSLGDSAPYLSGPEYQILDDANHADGKNASTSAGSLYALYAPEEKELQPVDDWNSAKIKVVGNEIEHWLNNKLVVSATIGSDDWNEHVAASKFKDWEKFGKNASGHICFQDHGNPVWFRNIRIRRLDKSAGE